MGWHSKKKKNTHKRTCKLKKKHDNGCINEKNDWVWEGGEMRDCTGGEERTSHFVSDRGRHRRLSGGGDYGVKDDLLLSLLFSPLSLLIPCSSAGEERREG